MVAQGMATCCACVAGATTDALNSGKMLVGNAGFCHGQAARLSESSVTKLNSISAICRLSPTAHQE